MLVLLLSGTGDVIETDDGILSYRLWRPICAQCSKSINKKHKAFNARERDVANESLNIAADVCIYTNHNIVIEEINL